MINSFPVIKQQTSLPGDMPRTLHTIVSARWIGPEGKPVELMQSPAKGKQTRTGQRPELLLATRHRSPPFQRHAAFSLLAAQPWESKGFSSQWLLTRPHNWRPPWQRLPGRHQCSHHEVFALPAAGPYSNSYRVGLEIVMHLSPQLVFPQVSSPWANKPLRRQQTILHSWVGTGETQQKLSWGADTAYNSGLLQGIPATHCKD